MKNKKRLIFLFVLLFISSFFTFFFKQEYAILFDFCSFNEAKLEDKFINNYKTFVYGEDMRVIANLSAFQFVLLKKEPSVISISNTNEGFVTNIGYGFGEICN